MPNQRQAKPPFYLLAPDNPLRGLRGWVYITPARMSTVNIVGLLHHYYTEAVQNAQNVFNLLLIKVVSETFYQISVQRNNILRGYSHP